jgi:hypothetical protein
MNTKILFASVAFCLLGTLASFAFTTEELKTIQTNNTVFACDSDSVKIDVNAPVISFDNRLYQLGIQIGTFEKKTSFKKGQLSVNILLFDMSGKAVAEAIAPGVNASFVVTIYDGNQKLSLDLAYDHEGEELALKLRQLGKL